MCGRYQLQIDTEELRQLIALIEQRYPQAALKSGEIFPSECAPLRCGKGRALPGRWGWPNAAGKGLLINVRAETIEQRPSFRQAFLSGRCLIPASGFYEWTAGPPKQRYYFQLPGEDYFYLAGIYRQEAEQNQDSAHQASDRDIDTLRYLVITTAANESISDIHERMPLIIRRSQAKDWLGDLAAARALLTATPPLLAKTPC